MTEELNLDRVNTLLETAANTQIYRVTDAERGRFEQVQRNPFQMNEALAPYPRDARGRMTINEQNFMEVSSGALSVANFPDLLRQGINFDVFSGYNEPATIWQRVAREVQSNKQQEEYLRDSGIGLLPVVNEGDDYPEAATNLGSGTTIKNYKRGYVVKVTEEMRRFDQLGKVRDLANSMGRAARLTEEQAVMDVLTTTTNYTRNSTTGDNDGGANTQTLTWSVTNLIVAYNILKTMKDRKTGQYLGVQPDTLVVAPKLWWAVRQLIGSPEVMRVGGSSTAEIHGTGTQNAFFGIVPNIIVSPMFGKNFEWWLGEAGRAVVLQRLDPITVTPMTYDFEDDTYKTRIRTWFGAGMKDDRFAFFSDSSTTPAVG